MWLRYASVVSFVSLLLAYGATLGFGWSYARVIPGLNDEAQQMLQIYCMAVAIIAWPVWAVHWYLVRQEWNWSSRTTQNYLIFYTVVGLVASVVIGVQLLVKLMDTREPWEKHQAFVIGAAWSVAWSLAVWLFHGIAWINHRRGRESTPATSQQGSGQTVKAP
jgi:uncharacterized protein with PQ loop repeat